MTSAVRVSAPAKLNLALSVGPPNATGMHPISSWMVTIDLFDELEVARLPDGSLSRYSIDWHRDARRRSPIDWSISKDLAVRAHLEIERLVGHPLPLEMRLRKRIPVGGGLGGGSSDAAAMIRAVDSIFRLGLDRAAMRSIAGRLGSDVAFLLDGGSAIVEGIGDLIEPLPAVPELHATLALPEVGCPTGPIYRRFDQQPGARLDAPRVRALAETMREVDPRGLFNDLAGAACAEAPSLLEISEGMSEIAGRPVHVSGSGSSLFVLCQDRATARGLAVETESRLGVPTVVATTTSMPTPESLHS